MIAKVLCTALVLGCVWGADVDDSNVKVLTVGNFEDVIQGNELVMVEFYAPWCGHCKKLAPEYAEAATTLKGTGIVVAKVDATVETELGDKFDVKGYPTLKVFTSGEVSEYEGGRSAKDIIQFLKKQAGPPVTDLPTAAAFDDFTADANGPTIVAFMESGTDAEMHYRTFAKAQRNDFAFGAVQNEGLAAEKGQKMGTVVLYKPFDERQNVWDGAPSGEEFLMFLREKTVPLVDEIGPDNYKMYIDRALPIVWMFYDPANADVFEAAKKEYSVVAPEFRGLSFVYLNGVQYNQMVTKMALSGEKLPAIAIETATGDHYTFDESKDITADNLRPWLQDYTDGKLSPQIRSEPVPENPVDEDGVYVLVGTTFEKVAMDTEKDVLVEFYAPWCGHCKKLAPIYSEVAKAVAGVDSVIVAKMDATANDAKGIQVQGFPTLKFIRGGDNEVMEYSGARTKDAFLEYLQKNANKAFEL